MNTIKFSHRYTKMPYDKSALLLQVFKVEYEDLSEVFVNYDTEILNTNLHYQIPNTWLLVLLLLSPSGCGMWTTIRRWTFEKEMFYRDLVGSEFNIYIEGE